MRHRWILAVAVLALAARAPAGEYPNELDGFKLHGRYCEGLEPMKSTVDDVRKALGAPVEGKSGPWVLWYERDDWDVLVYIFPANGRYPTWIAGRTVESIDFIPKGRKSLANTTFTTAFNKEAVKAADAAWNAYYDAFGLVYQVYTSNPPFGDKERGDLNRISYRPAPHAMMSMQHHQLERTLQELEKTGGATEKPDKTHADKARKPAGSAQ